MKRWINKIWLLIQYEKNLMIRTRKGLLLILVLIGLGILSIILMRTGPPRDSYNFSEILYNAYIHFIQFLPFALAVVLADAISGEKERRTWDFFMSKPFTKTQILLSKLLTDYITVALAIVLMWGVVFLIINSMTSEMDCNWGQFLTLVAISLAVVFAIVSFEIAISAVSKRVAIAVLLIVTGWILLMILNTETPLLKGFIAPWSMNSYQISVITRLLDTGFIPTPPFISLTQYPSITEIWRAIWAPLLEGLIFCIFAVLAIKR